MQRSALASIEMDLRRGRKSLEIFFLWAEKPENNTIIKIIFFLQKARFQYFVFPHLDQDIWI